MSVILYKLFLRTRQTLLVTRFQSATERKLVTAMDEAPSENSDIISMRNNVTEILRSKNSTRYKQRWKRPWDEPKPEDGESNEKKAKSVNAERIKRKKMAVLLGYCGADYFGMQRNPGVRTIEEDLLKALLDAKYITEEDFNNQQNMQFQRSSRTDKGVSAARQVVSLKLPLELSIDEVNKRLPECIRVFGVKRVTNKFNSKVKCNGRTYSYTLPTYVFEGSANTLEERKKYRITQEKLEKVKNILSVYKGTKCYFNFTEKKHFQDPSASRYMMSFVLDRLFEHSEMEFAVLLVKGQSFMIHQIRKMVGLAIAIARGHTDMSTMDRAFSKDKVMIPTAPGLGLVLDKVHYDRYAAKHSSHDNLSWDEEEPTIMKFIEEQIYPYIVKGEIETDNMGLWLETKLNNHSYEPAEDIVCETEAPDVEKETNDSDDECEVTDKKSD